jgi:hypothetical protein
MTKNMKALSTTRGHKTFVVKWLFGHPATHQLSKMVHKKGAQSPKVSNSKTLEGNL